MLTIIITTVHQITVEIIFKRLVALLKQFRCFLSLFSYYEMYLLLLLNTIHNQAQTPGGFTWRAEIPIFLSGHLSHSHWLKKNL